MLVISRPLAVDLPSVKRWLICSEINCHLCAECVQAVYSLLQLTWWRDQRRLQCVGWPPHPPITCMWGLPFQQSRFCPAFLYRHKGPQRCQASCSIGWHVLTSAFDDSPTWPSGYVWAVKDVAASLSDHPQIRKNPKTKNRTVRISKIIPSPVESFISSSTRAVSWRTSLPEME